MPLTTAGRNLDVMLKEHERHILIAVWKDKKTNRDRLERLLLQMASHKNLLGIIRRKKKFEVSQLRVSWSFGEGLCKGES